MQRSVRRSFIDGVPLNARLERYWDENVPIQTRPASRHPLRAARYAALLEMLSLLLPSDPLLFCECIIVKLVPPLYCLHVLIRRQPRHVFLCTGIAAESNRLHVPLDLVRESFVRFKAHRLCRETE